MRTRLYSLVLFMALVCASAYAKTESVDSIAEPDSVMSKKKFVLDDVLKWPVIGIIYPSLSPETGWAIGAGVQGTWNMPQEETPSSLRLMACYTQYHQWRIQTSGFFYMGGKKPWQLQFILQYRDYPDVFYGLSNTMPSDTIDYESKRFNTTIEPLFRLPHHWNIGPMLDVLWERVDHDSLSNGKAYTTMWGLGVSAQYDTRQGVYYPTKGIYFKFKGFRCEPILGSDCHLWKLDADFRHFITLWAPTNCKNDFQRVNGSLIFAYQVRLQAALTGEDNANIPFQMLPTLGGDEVLRGIRTNMFRQNTLWAVQTELRFPIYRVLHGTAFASVGDVYDTQHWNWTTPKVGYGVGLRLTVNRAHVNVRIDVARNNIDTNWSEFKSYNFYITASEAF